ncbi:TonB C-terminal domain-containing protein [Roseateles sp.]|uniref:TonB C-terminal domain-containing protein n=1 Tax=Roseateles sp. TaxID=1971397 RepID=UPI0025DFE3A7|nr:TonB C-terminal domain-containing protein [Roseateles sp.]MBV8034190.1 TonB C-terminal domain-containing protein [Roseateles sp.]
MSRWSTGPRLAPTPASTPAASWPHGRRGAPAHALLVSLLVHALLLSLTFGGEGLGLPGLTLPWQARRAEVPDLRVVLVTPTAEPVGVPAPPAEAPTTHAATTPAPQAEVTQAVDDAPPAAPAALPVIAVDKPREATWSVPPAPPASVPVIAAFAAASGPPIEVTRLREPGDASRAALERGSRERAVELARLDGAGRETQQQAQQQAERLAAAQAEADRQEAARLEAARQEVARKEAARLDAERQEAQRQAAARLEATRVEAARLEAERQESARRATAQQEAARQEAAQAEAARAEAARIEAARQDAIRQEAARQDAARAEAARAEAARLAAAKAAEELREARLRAIGQQLNEEATRRDAARQAQSNLPSSWSSARRGRLFGRADANAEMVLYAEAWARKIQLNPTFELVREAVGQPHTDPLVTVALRSDGTVESVSFVRSSGVPAIDAAVRRVVESQANYPAFPPALAREYDVIEIRRSWHFDTAIRLY